MRRVVIICGIALASCEALPVSTAPQAAQAAAPAQRIVSLDYCADQYVLKMVEREHILALSPDAAKPFSYMHEQAAGISTVRPLAENVLILKPDLVVRSYGGGPNADGFFKRAGIPVLNLGWAQDFNDIKTLTRDMAKGLGVPEKGEDIVRDMETRLMAIEKQTPTKTALYVTPGGVTSGAGSLVHEIIQAAGYDNFQTQSGWRELPLETLAYTKPDLIAAAFYDSEDHKNNAWSSARHPIITRQLAEQPTVNLEGAWMSCSGWWMVDAVEALANRPNEAAQ